MSTSGTITFNMTARRLVTHALQSILGVVPTLSDPAADQMVDGVRALDMMLKGWQITGPHLSRQTFGSVALVAATASYTLSPKPYRVIEARYRDASGRDMPMLELTRQEYVDLPLKSATGVPTQYYVDYQRTAATLYVWPVPASVTTETIQTTYQRAFDDIGSDFNNDIDIPQEWFETIAYNLADRLIDQYAIDKDAKRITGRAQQLLATALDMEREDSVRFVPERMR